MKCIKCNTDNNLKDRTANQGRCLRCNHRFAFEPTSMGKEEFTDGFFAKVIQDISANNTLVFTPKQFLYLFDQRLKLKSKVFFFSYVYFYLFFSVWITVFLGGLLSIVLGSISSPLVLATFNFYCIYYLFNLTNSAKTNYQVRQSGATALQILGFFVLIVGGIYSFSNNSILFYFLTILVGLPALWLGFLQKRRIPNIPETFLVSGAQMQDWLNTWKRANGEIVQLLPEPDFTLPSTTQNTTASDVTAYSFDRLVVCQSAEIAQMLIGNNFHFENNCAILSIMGYPPAIFGTVIQMLRRNPELKVYAFHDASPEGVSLVHQLRTNPVWFSESNVTIVDLGLLPRQVLATRRHLFVHRTIQSKVVAKRLAPEIRQNLTEAELAWLDAGNYVELESFTPQRLINILNRGITGSEQLDLSDSGIIIWGDGSDSAIYAVDSFG